MLSAGADGPDGPTDAAGAWVHRDTVQTGLDLGLKARRHLERHDAYPCFQALGDLLIRSSTRTNIMDIQIMLVTSGWFSYKCL
ncbi:hypothetical protein DFAR_2120006 [Desulfarculales bacterium]